MYSAVAVVLRRVTLQSAHHTEYSPGQCRDDDNDVGDACVKSLLSLSGGGGILNTKEGRNKQTMRT